MIDSNKLKSLPDKPGIYLMKDIDGNIIYVGKAINLKNRVRQYFRDSEKSTIKVAIMVDNIEDFEIITTDTEMEALILECNLIKKYMPRFNVMLKDDKSYPFIKVTINEKYPRVIMTRKIKKDGAKYYGPFTNVLSVKQTIELINKLYPIKMCNRKFNNKKKERPCLNYHINQCLGVCQGNVPLEEYQVFVNEIINILNGKYENVLEKLKIEMQDASKYLDFEKAAKIRDQINGIIHITEKQKIITNSFEDQDVIGFNIDESIICIQVFFIRKGKLLGREHFIFEEVHDEKDVLNQFVKQFYNNASFIPKEILLQSDIDDLFIIQDWLSDKKGRKVTIRIPKKGNKKKLINMVEDNAKVTLNEHKIKIDKNKKKMDEIYQWFKENIGIKEFPYRIEAFDISNIKGTDNVGSMVVFENIKANKKAYRRYKIKNITGQNDYGSMQEIVFRRIERGLKELKAGEKGSFLPLPNIILLDGGLGHVNSIKEILKLYPQINIPICGLVKDEHHRLREIIYEGENIKIPPSTQIYYFLNNISEEVHRFAIEYHRKVRKDNLIQSELNNIEGVGDVKRNLLLKYFRNIDNIKKATVEELLQVEGINDKIAKNICDYFR
ncbi:MAG: excinuclease ABC subunit UvrC [Eubacteriaceae bacterium]